MPRISNFNQQFDMIACNYVENYNYSANILGKRQRKQPAKRNGQAKESFKKRGPKPKPKIEKERNKKPGKKQ